MVKRLLKILNKYGIHPLVFIFFVLAGLMGYLFSNQPKYFYLILDILFSLLPVWLPIILLMVFWKYWVGYVRLDYMMKMSYILLEIKLPREIAKTPLAMETVLSGLHATFGETTILDRYWLGKTRTHFSLELVSVEGEIHFLIWTRPFFKDLIESRIYSQYPEVEVYEVDDYTKYIQYDLNQYAFWGCNVRLSKPDPYPIKTYVDYGQDRDQGLESEQRVESLAPLLEHMGSIGKGEQLWLQVIIRSNKNQKRKTAYGKLGWQDEAKALVNDILKRDPLTKGTREKTPEGYTIFPTHTKGETEAVAAIERSSSKLGFDTGIRFLYIAKKENFRAIGFVSMLVAYKQFNDANLNGFRPFGGVIDFDWPWEDFRDIRKNLIFKHLFNAYRLRSWFYYPYKEDPFVLTTEELATIYHFPGQVVQTPTIGRIPSRRGEAPPNLPR